MQKTWVPSLGQEDPLEKEMATYSSIFAWGLKESDSTEVTEHACTHLMNGRRQGGEGGFFKFL